MENILIALDDRPGSLKTVHYVSRLFMGSRHVEIILFHVLPTTSPNLLKKEEVLRIEELHEAQPHLSGYFWNEDDENSMLETFRQARQILAEGGFDLERVRTHFGVESTEVAQVILEQARAFNCSTIVVGRRGLSRVKEFFLGSVSKSLVGYAKNRTVWVVDA